MKEELCVIGKVVLRGTRIVIPQRLRQQALAIAHEGHVEIVARKLRLRTKVWWPGIDKEAEQYVRSCHRCQLVGQATPPEPLMPTELPLANGRTYLWIFWDRCQQGSTCLLSLTIILDIMKWKS